MSLQVINVQWEPPQNAWDFHILRNDLPSSPLNRILEITYQAGPTIFSKFATQLPAGITVEFRAQLRAVDLRRNYGVIFDTTTGTVQAGAQPPSEPKLRSFIIQVKVTNRNTNPPKENNTQIIRCHIHDNISRFWLTPSGLTVRHNSTGQKFSLLAQFSDDTVGVIPENAGVQWESNSTDIQVDRNSGRITANASGSVAIISAILPQSLGGGNVSEAVFAADSWETPTAVDLIQGNAAKMAENLNFLFIPDGFTAGEKLQFERLVRGFVRDLPRRTSTKPFNILSNSINYWMAFIPSRESGTSVLYHMKPFSRNGNLRGSDTVPFPERPPTNSGLWTLPQLVHEVGLPIPGDKNQHREFLGDEFNTMLSRWKKWFGDNIEAHVNERLYDKWQELGDLRIANERDTALGLAAGSPPSASTFSPTRLLTWHPFRATRAQLDSFLSNLTHNGSNTIGDTWVTGKDRPFVIVICGGGRFGGAGPVPPTEHITTSVTTETEVVLKPAVPSRAVDLIPFANPANIMVMPTATLFHEISHAIFLGDEYGGQGHLPTDQIPNMNKYLNLQDAVSLTKPAGGIEGNKIKWLWHRISKAGVLADAPFPIGISDYRIKLKSNHASLFKVGDIVHLRQRPLVLNAVVSEELIVTSKVRDGVDVNLLRGGGPDPETFTANSLLFAPVRREIGGVTANLLLVAPKIVQHINATGGPLTAPRGNQMRACDPNDDELKKDRQDARNLPAELLQKPLQYRSQIVGLYESGYLYFCGVYHPSGACLMRSLVDTDISGNPISIYNFCHVCKYILVDMIDPSKHGLIDADYERRYPL